MEDIELSERMPPPMRTEAASPELVDGFASPVADQSVKYITRPPKQNFNRLNFQEDEDAPFYPDIANHSVTTIGGSVFTMRSSASTGFSSHNVSSHTVTRDAATIPLPPSTPGSMSHGACTPSRTVVPHDTTIGLATVFSADEHPMQSASSAVKCAESKSAPKPGWKTRLRDWTRRVTRFPKLRADDDTEMSTMAGIHVGQHSILESPVVLSRSDLPSGIIGSGSTGSPTPAERFIR
ncbi:hypothetical protein CC79DRAFT_1364884 [Sarocladium strictum]